MAETIEKRAGRLVDAVGRGYVPDVARLTEGLADDERRAFARLVLPAVRERLSEDVRQWLGPATGAGDSLFPRIEAARLTLAALGDRRDVERSLFSARLLEHDDGWQEARAKERFPFRAGLALLKRPEPWAREMVPRIVGDRDRDARHPGCRSRFALGIHLIESGTFTEEELLPDLARAAAKDSLVAFDWQTARGRRILWTALETRDDAQLAYFDYDGKLSARLTDAAARGSLERPCLIAVCLRRLGEVSRTFEANWWARLLEQLAPVDAEWREHAQAAVELAAAPSMRAAALGVERAKWLLDEGAVGPDVLLPLAGAAAANQASGVAKSAVSLLRALGRRDLALRAEALAAALNALTHPKPAVHESVLSWLKSERWWREDPSLAAVVAGLAETAAASTAARLREMLPAGAGTSAGEPPSALAPPGPGASLRAALEGRMGQEKDPARSAWLAACLAALDGTSPLPEPLEPPEESWRHHPRFALPPSAEETVLFLTSRETYDEHDRDSILWHPPTLEWVVAGLRLPVREEERPLVLRALGAGRRSRLTEPLIRAWEAVLNGEQPPDPWPPEPEAPRRGGFQGLRDKVRSVSDFFSMAPSQPAWLPPGPVPQQYPHLARRVRAAVEALARGDHELPLCTPTHETGWLDPEVFAERLERRAGLGKEEGVEFWAALYRVAPGDEPRHRAWERIAPLLARFEERVRLALATALAPEEDARDSLSRLAGLAARGSEEARLLSAGMRCRWGMALPPGDRQMLAQLFGVAPGQEDRDLRDYYSTEKDWPALYEGDRAFQLPFCAVLTAGDDPLRDLVLPLRSHADLDPRRQLPTVAGILADPEAKRRHPTYGGGWQAAVGWVAAGLRDGSLRTTDVAGALARAMTGENAPSRAVLDALLLLAPESPVCREVAAEVAEQALAGGMAGLPAPQRPDLLDALLGWRTAGSQPVLLPDARAVLEGLCTKGRSGRMAALARQLLALPPAPAGTPSPAELRAAHDVAGLLRRSRDFRDLAPPA